MKTRDCFLCGSSRSQKIAIESVSPVGGYVLCRDCGLVYHNPVMTEEEYSDYYKHQYAESYFDALSMQMEIAEKRFDFLRSELPDVNGSVLEIGCSIGAVLHKFAEQGFSVFGVEPSTSFVERANQEFDLEVFNGVYDELPRREDFYTLINLFHVLEHLVDPVPALQRIKGELVEGGYLYVVVPTYRDHQLSMVFKTIHPTVFSVETLTMLLEYSGFEILKVEIQGNSIAVIAQSSGESSRLTHPADSEKVLKQIESHLAERKKLVDAIISRLSLLDSRQHGSIYCAGHTTVELNDIYDLARLNIDAVYDSDPEKTGRTLLGYTVQHRDDLEHFDGDYIIIASYAYQEDICRDLGYLEERGVELIRLYDKGD